MDRHRMLARARRGSTGVLGGWLLLAVVVLVVPDGGCGCERTSDTATTTTTAGTSSPAGGPVAPAGGPDGGGAPLITGVQPGTGPVGGGTLVTVSGSGLAGTSGALVGGRAGTSVSARADGTAVSFLTPAGAAAGRVDVTLTGLAFGSVTAAGAFEYLASAAGFGIGITQVEPATGPLGGGTAVTLRGAGFAGDVTVTFGGRAASGVAVNAAGTVALALTPVGTVAGPVDVTVTSAVRKLLSPRRIS